MKISFKEFLEEGIRLKDDEFEFDFKKDLPEDFVNLTYGSKKVLKSSVFNFVPIFYAYGRTHYDDNKDIKNRLIQLFKNKKDVSDEVFQKLLNKAIIRFDNISPIQNFDVIICPKSSSTGLTELLAKFHERNTHAIISNEVIVKNVKELIEVNYDLFKEKLKTEDDSLLRQRFESAFDKNGIFSIKKVDVKFRNFISNFMKINGKVDERNVFNALCGGRVLIVDDVVSGGSTLKDIVRQVQKFAPKEIKIFVLFRNQKT